MPLSIFKPRGLTTEASQQKGLERNLRLENAITNVLKLVKGNNLLVNQESIRLGSLSIIAHSKKDEVLFAMENLRKNGTIHTGQEVKITDEIIKLLSSNELKNALNRKVAQETKMSIDHFRKVSQQLAKAPIQAA